MNGSRIQFQPALELDPDGYLEAAIAAVTKAMIKTRDGRYADIQRRLIAMRSPEQVKRMEAQAGTGVKR